MLEERVRAAESVAVVWNGAAVPFVVMHGLETYPQDIGRDLDILMPSEESEHALQSASEVLRELGWRVARPSPIFGPRIVALKGDRSRPMYLEFHTMPALRWAALDLITPVDLPDSSVGPFPVSSWITFAKAVVSPLLGKDLARFDSQYLSEIELGGPRAESIETGGSKLFGPDLTTRLLSAVDRLDADGVKELSEPLRRMAFRHMLGSPGQSMKALPRFLGQKTGRIRDTSGIRVSIEFPPTTDRERVLTSLTDRVRHIFSPIDVNRQPSWRRRLAEQYRTLSRQGLVIEVVEGDPASSSIRVRFRGGTSEATLVEYPLSGSSEADATAEIARSLIDEWWYSLEGAGAIDKSDVIVRNRIGED